MANADTHRQLVNALMTDMRAANHKEEWPIIVDAGYYALFHSIEALNALECRDSYSFADFSDILENIVTVRLLDPSIVNVYNYLFYFRKGVIYGSHEPTMEQISEYAQIAEEAVTYVQTEIGAKGQRGFAAPRVASRQNLNSQP